MKVVLVVEDDGSVVGAIVQNDVEAQKTFDRIEALLEDLDVAHVDVSMSTPDTLHEVEEAIREYA